MLQGYPESIFILIYLGGFVLYDLFQSLASSGNEDIHLRRASAGNENDHKRFLGAPPVTYQLQCCEIILEVGLNLQIFFALPFIPERQLR